MNFSLPNVFGSPIELSAGLPTLSSDGAGITIKTTHVYHGNQGLGLHHQHQQQHAFGHQHGVLGIPSLTINAASGGAYPGQAPSVWSGAVPPGIDPLTFQYFTAVDTDRSGQITVHELQRALVNANWSNFSLETCRIMIGLFDRDRNGTIGLNEFQGLWNYLNTWKGVFDQFDRDRSGNIDVTELNTAFSQIGYRTSPGFSALVVMRYAQPGTQRLTLENFIQACAMVQSLTDAFKQKDITQQGFIQISYEDFLTMVLLTRV